MRSIVENRIKMKWGKAKHAGGGFGHRTVCIGRLDDKSGFRLTFGWHGLDVRASADFVHELAPRSVPNANRPA